MESNAALVLPTDKDLINRTVSGDTEAFGELFKRYKTFIYSVGVKCCGGHAEAEDLLQETFIKALGSISGFRGESSFRGWLAAIARNHCLDRKKKRSIPTVSLDEPLDRVGDGDLIFEIPDTTNNPERILLQKEAAGVVNKAILSLPDYFRETLIMHDLEGLPVEEISALKGLKISTAKSRLHRARTRVRDRVETYFKQRN